MSERLLTIDLGTTACKVSLFTPGGDFVASGQAAYPLRSPEPGAAEQDPADWQAALWRALGQLAEERAEDVRSVIAIGPTAQMNALVLLDGHDRPMGTALSSMDQRPVLFSARVRETLAQEGSAIYVGRNSVLARMTWLRARRPEAYAECARLADPRGLLHLWLTGELGTDAASVGVEAWTPEVVEALEFPAHKLPAIYRPWHIIGWLSADVAHRFGLTEGIPVVVGTGDGASANIGAGAIRPGQGCITLGTTGVARCVLPDPLPVTEVLPTFAWPFLDGLWVGGALSPAGACLSWLRRLLAGDAGAPESSGWLEALLPKAADLPPGSDGLIFLPFLFGTGRPGREEYAALRRLRFDHGPAHLLRAIFEGTACALKVVVEFLESQGQPPVAWRGTGGGMRHPLWRQIAADVLDRPLRLTNGDSSLGAAILAAVGVGIYPDVPSAVAAMVRTELEVVPIPDNAAGYRQVFEDYLAQGLPTET